MIILLLTLLGIALTVTLAGLWLSFPKTQVRNQRGISYAGRATGIARTGVSGQMRARRYPVEAERRSWASVLAPINLGNIFGAGASRPTSWLGILFILLALFGFSIFTLRTLLINPGLVVNPFLSDSAMATAAAAKANSSSNTSNTLFAGLAGASKALERIGQLDPAQYASSQEYNTWAYSTCSAAAMTEVINAYGNHYRLTDILSVEARLGEITPDLGLVEPSGVDHTVAQFGFKTVSLTNAPLDQVISVANQGRPVIVGWPPDRWAGGHILVVRGGDSQNVYLADSSRLNYQIMPRTRFLQLWGGFAVVVIPK
ncbi:MAG: C39 family peptidase [Chloroflexi bacterium]|nr:C39 family peptidase [Chloroflexota bacterium]